MKDFPRLRKIVRFSVNEDQKSMILHKNTELNTADVKMILNNNLDIE